eukprot:1832700-Amphidinium_carterae.1
MVLVVGIVFSAVDSLGRPIPLTFLDRFGVSQDVESITLRAQDAIKAQGAEPVDTVAELFQAALLLSRRDQLTKPPAE